MIGLRSRATFNLLDGKQLEKFDFFCTSPSPLIHHLSTAYSVWTFKNPLTLWFGGIKINLLRRCPTL